MVTIKLYQNSGGVFYRIRSVGCQIWFHDVLLADYYAIVNSEHEICPVICKGLLKKKYEKTAYSSIVDYCEKMNPDKSGEAFFINFTDSPLY